MSDTRNNYYLIFISRKQTDGNNNLNNFTIFTVTSPLVFPWRQEKRREIYRNFAIFTVTVPLVLLTGTKDSEKFTKISQYSQ